MRLQPLRVTVAAMAIGMVASAATAIMASSASAHGAVADPVTRAYDCSQRYQSPSDPGLANDPMCAQAFRADPNAIYNWNGLFREGLAGRHQASIPDGTLCSGGNAQGGRYAALDVPGNWNATSKPNNFTLRINDPSSHGADYLRVYITRQGFNPLTQRLTWGDLELVTETGRQPTTGTYTASVNAGSRTGRHIVYTIWQASHLDQSYYACSDVVFGGGGTGPGPNPSTPTSSSPRPSASASSSPAPNPGTGACTATVRVASSWQGGYQAEVSVRAGTAAIRGWRVSFTGTVQQGWGATFSGSGTSAVATNAAYNGALAANGTASFGFIGTGTAPTTATCTAA